MGELYRQDPSLVNGTELLLESVYTIDECNQ